MRAGADVPEPVDRRGVTGRRGQRAPEQVLVERARARVDVAADEVAVERFDVGGREDDALQGGRLEVLDRLAEPGDDPVGVRLAQLLRPGAVTDVDLAGGIALETAGGQLLELDPDDRLAVGRARRVEAARLAAHDRRLGGQQTALRLVDRARDAVETGRHVDDGAACELGRPVALPARRRVEREVDLHLGAAVAEALRRARSPSSGTSPAPSSRP